MTEAVPDYFTSQLGLSPATRDCFIDLCFLMRRIERALSDCHTGANEKQLMSVLMVDVKRSHDSLLTLSTQNNETPHE